jgi:hypothetical protein
VVRRWISVLDLLPHYRRADLPNDDVAGLTGEAVLVPQSMAGVNHFDATTDHELANSRPTTGIRTCGCAL